MTIVKIFVDNLLKLIVWIFIAIVLIAIYAALLHKNYISSLIVTVEVLSAKFFVTFLMELVEESNSFLHKLTSSIYLTLANKKWKSSNYFVQKYLELTSLDSYFIRIDKLDELINKLYSKTKGKIVLFNPSKELMDTDERNKTWQEIRDSIRENIINIEKIIFIVDISNFSYNVDFIANKIKIPPCKIEIIEIKGKTLTDLSNHARMALYFSDNDNVKQIEHFLYRPTNEPYLGNFVFIQGFKVIESAKIPQSNNISLHNNIIQLLMASSTQN